MADERIHVLRDILLELHNGASPESVQERFDATFTGVSAIEISLMEHELMNSDSGVTFEDVMELCDVHANLFKNAVKGVEVEDTEHPGHPVRVFKDENLDDFFYFLFKNYKLIYTKLQEPVSEIIKNISYKEVEVEKITKDSHDMSYMNSSGDLFSEKYSLIEIKVSDIAIEFEDSFSGLIPQIILTKFRQYLKEQVELYSKTIQVRSSVIYNDDGKLIDVNIFLKEIKEDIIESLFQDVHDEIQGILSVIELSFNPIEINYYFGIGEFILEFKDPSNARVDPVINKEHYNKISLGRIDLDGDKKYSFIELLSDKKNKKAMNLLFDVFEKIVSQTLEELALDGQILNLANLLTGGIPIFMFPDENIRKIKEDISYKVLKDIKKIAMSIDPNQWNRIWSVIGESL